MRNKQDLTKLIVFGRILLYIPYLKVRFLNMFTTLFPFILASFLAFSPLPISLPANLLTQADKTSGLVLTQNTLSLTNRYPDLWVNEVFADNIVLTLRYLKGDLNRETNNHDWGKIREPFGVSFSLKPGETFAFHNDPLPEFKGKVVKTTAATFNWQQGFRSDGWLIGDGVCHLASFINQAAQEAGLTVLALTNHDFASIPDVPREFGTSIFYLPGNASGNARQNLYITNSQDREVTFTFIVTPEKINLTISKLIFN